MAVFHGTKHDDTFNESSDTGADTFDLYKGGNDSVIAGSGDDRLNMGTSLNADDRLDGGAGRDVVFLHGDYSGGVTFDDQTIQNIEVLRLGRGFDYNLTLADGNVAAGKSLTINASPLGAGNHLTFDGSLESDGHFLVYGGAGDDTLTGGGGNDRFNLITGGNDTVHGGGGNDVFLMGGTFTSGDVIDGGAGNNTLSLNGSYNRATIGSAQVTNIETLKLAGTYILFRITGDIAGGNALTIDASAATSLSLNLGSATSVSYNILGGSQPEGFNFGTTFSEANKIFGTGGYTVSINGDHSDGITFDAANLGGVTHLVLTGDNPPNAFNATVIGDITHGSSSNTLLISLGTQNAVNFVDLTQATTPLIEVFNTNSNPNTTVKFAGNCVAGDVINGINVTDHMSVELDGDYSSGLTFDTDTHATGVALFDVNALKLDDGFSYNLTITGDITTAAATVTIDGSNITHSADSITLDLSAATSGGYAITGGSGADMMKFGGNFTASDTFNGGTGSDTLELHGDYSAGLTFGASTITNIETLKLDDGFSYKLTTTDGNVATGATMTVDASALTGTNALTFNGSAENGGFYSIKGGAGADSVTFGSHFSVSDTFDGGAGNDTLTLTNIQGTFNFADATINNVEDLVVTVHDGSLASITTTDANVASGSTMTVDFSSSGLLDRVGITFDGSAETDGHFNIIAPQAVLPGGGHFTGGALSDTFSYGAVSTDIDFNGLGGDDTVTTVALSSGLVFDGGSGNDTLAFTGGGTVNNNYNLTSVETVTFDDNNWTVVERDGMVAAGASLIVDATALTGSHSISFNGSAETNGSFSLIGGAGNDTLTGGSQADNILGGLGADTLTGGGGADVFVYTAANQSSSTTYDTIKDFAAGTDAFDLTSTVLHIAAVSGTVNTANFDANLQALGASHLQTATVLTVTGGDLNGHVFLVVDGDGNAQYNAGSDYVIDITGYTGTLTTGDFF